MRKIFIIALLTFASIGLENPAKAQAYAPGQLQINAGISAGLLGYGGYFGAWGWGGYRRTGFVPLFALAEYGFHKWISAGPYIGYYSRGYRHRSLDHMHRWSHVNVGVRGTFHWVPLMRQWGLNIDEDRWDFYASLITGLEFRSYSYNGPGTNLIGGSGGTRLIVGPVVGARYMFSKNLGAFAETGRGMFGLASIGMTFKL
ncbi:MAG: hypothetical protein ACK4ND_04510 [Cytophagaceae bacterium]